MSTTEAPVLDESRARQFSAAFCAIRDNMQLVVRGKQDVIEHTILCLLAGGHALLEDVPGVGKTTLAKALGRSLGAEIGRIQFTPDLLPADVTGVSIWDRNSGEFEFRPGPIFAEIVLADEINRASPKTQSALLEAMAEFQVTVDGTSRSLSSPFMVLATQNPLEQEGTYPLPESQLDRFLMKLSVGYPSRGEELKILQTHEEDRLVDRLQPVASLRDISAMTAMIRSVSIAPELREYMIDFAEATRQHPAIALGMSPRCTLALQRVARARAAAAGRVYVTDDDIKSLVLRVVDHRLALHPEASIAGVTSGSVIEEILRTTPVPYSRT